jgi:hypothetical protein
MDAAQYLIPAAAGLLSGILGSLVAPWIHWGIEARRERAKSRRALIAEARLLLAKQLPIATFRKHPVYFQIKPHLSEGTNALVIGEFDQYGYEVVVLVSDGPYAGVQPYAHLVLDELSRIEARWGLV